MDDDGTNESPEPEPERAVGERIVDDNRPESAQDPARIVDLPGEPARSFSPPKRDDNATVAELNTPRYGAAVGDDEVIGVVFETDLDRAAEWWDHAPGEVLAKIAEDYNLRVCYLPERRVADAPQSRETAVEPEAIVE